MSIMQPLVIFHKQLGDVLLLEPALARLAAATDSEVMLATRQAFAPLLAIMDKVRPLPEGIFRRASQVISFDPRSRACLQTVSTWAPDKRLIVPRSKYLKPWHSLFFPTERRVVDESALYRAEYYFNLMPPVAGMTFRPPRLNPPPPEWLPSGLPEQYTLLHATSAWPSKSWPAQAWGKVLDELELCGLGPYVITGGSEPWEKHYIDLLRQSTGAPVINMCGKTTLPGYLATVANARMAMCIDGSAAHLAAAFGRPVLTLFGPSHPLHWHYLSPKSALLDARTFSAERKPSVAAIPVEAVVDAAIALAQQAYSTVPAD